MKQRNNSIDAIKGIAIILVMIGHVFVHNQMEDRYLYDFIKVVQMPLFIIISGYLCGQGRKISNIKAYGKVMGKRAIAYLVPFFSWLTIMHLANLGEAYRTIFFQLDYGLWFLAVLFILTFMVYTAQLAGAKFREKKPMLSEMIFWGVYGGFCLMLLIQLVIGNSFLSPYLTIIYVPFYMIGYVIGNYGKKYLCWGENVPGKIDCKNNVTIRQELMIATFLLVFFIVKRNLNSMNTKAEIIIQMLCSLFACALVVYGVLWWNDESKLKNIFAKIGEYTLEIYVIHYHFANMLNFNHKQYDFYTLEGFVFVVLSFIVMSAATLVSIWILKKVNILDFLLFGRNHKSLKNS